jgi:hypothetical protein
MWHSGARCLRLAVLRLSRPRPDGQRQGRLILARYPQTSDHICGKPIFGAIYFRNASSSALTWSFKVVHMPCGAPL